MGDDDGISMNISNPVNLSPRKAARPSISFIVLALNEEAHIESTVQAILEAVAGSAVSDYELILVNDGSQDQTGSIMDQVARRDRHVHVVHNEHNLGLGGAYKRGLGFARFDYVMIVAGDNAMPTGDMKLILDRLGEADIVLPYLSNPKLRPLVRRIGSRGFTATINTMFGLHIKYYQGMLPRRELLSKISIQTNSYAFPTEVVVKLVKAGCTYVEVGIPNTPAHRGSSVALQPKRLLAVFKAVISLVRELRRPGSIPSLIG